MSVNSVQQGKSSVGAAIQDTLINQGKNALVGGAIGLATGRVVSLAAPVTHEQIAQKIVDHFVKNDKTAFDKIKDLNAQALQKEITKEQFESIKNQIQEIKKPFLEKAKNELERFFKLAKKERAKDDIVAIAKKAAKKSQSAKIMGTAAGVGILVMLFSNLFSGILPKKNVAKEGAVQKMADSKLATHQG